METTQNAEMQIKYGGYKGFKAKFDFVMNKTASYFVEIGPSTMSKDDIMNGRLICNVGIAPSRPAEFVIFRVTQFTSEASAGGEG